MKRIIGLVLVLIMLASVFSACSLGGKSRLTAELDEEGRFIWAIVRSTSATDEVENASKSLRTTLKSSFDGKITILKDGAAKYDPESHEILVGLTDREFSVETAEILKNNRAQNGRDFIVRANSNQVAIYGMNPKMTAIATEWFENTFCQTPEDFKRLYDGYQYIYEADMETTVSKIGDADLGIFSVVYPRFMSYTYGMYIEKYSKYLDGLGYTMNSDDERGEEKNFEIIVGDTTRAASKSVEVEGDNYVIKVVGTKLVIKGGNDLATQAAMKFFYETVVNAYDTKTPFSWSDGYTINGKYDPDAEGAYINVFSDDFEGNSIDKTKWGDYDYGGRMEQVGSSCLGGKEYSEGIDYAPDPEVVPERYTRVYQADGTIHLPTERLNETDFMGFEVGTYYTTFFRYGIWETTVKFADEPSTCSIWANGAAATYTDGHVARFGSYRCGFTELDVVENFGRANFVAANVHRWTNVMKADGSNAASGGHTSLDADPAFTNGTNLKNHNYDAEKNGDNLCDNFHILTLYWDRYCYKFAMDGIVWCDYQYSKTEQSVSVHCTPVYMLYGGGMGGSSYGTKYDPQKHLNYYETQIDRVVLYQVNDGHSQTLYGYGEKMPKQETREAFPGVPISLQY